MTNSLPWNSARNSRINSNWVTTDEMPVATTASSSVLVLTGSPSMAGSCTALTMARR